MNAWLTDLGFEEYYDLFVQSGYDMHTITRMTPEVIEIIQLKSVSELTIEFIHCCCLMFSDRI